jgi:hypothetical protein
MNSALDLLGKIFKPAQIAAITINGLISAFAVALLLWPPTPINVIRFVGKDEVKLVGNEPVIDVPSFEVKKDGDCRAVPRFLKTASDPGEIKNIAVENQLTLETDQVNLQKCLDFFNSELGDLATDDKQISDQITVLRTAQTSAQTDFLAYQKAGSPLQSKFRERYDEFTGQISNLQSQIVNNEQKIRDQNLQINTFTEYLAVIKLRLSDPGRIRSSQGFDDVLQGIANHIAGFLALAVVVGTAFQPFQRVFLGAFDSLLKTNP